MASNPLFLIGMLDRIQFESYCARLQLPARGRAEERDAHQIHAVFASQRGLKGVFPRRRNGDTC
jgi:hypothetical protein